MARLSALICVHNEEARLAECLSRLAFADELMVVLDRCTDGSAAIAKHFGAVTVEGAFPLEGPRRAAGAAAATGDWILEIDADEYVSPQLAAEVRDAVEADQGDWRQIPVDNYIGARLVKYGWGGSFGTTSVARLFRRGVKSWGTQRVHPSVTFVGEAGPSLRTPIRHEVDDNISDMLRRLDRYTELRARDLAENGEWPGLGRNAFRGVRRFYKCYVSRQGWREGGWGFLIALMAAIYPLLSVLRMQLEVRGSASMGQDPTAACADAVVSTSPLA